MGYYDQDIGPVGDQEDREAHRGFHQTSEHVVASQLDGETGVFFPGSS